MPAEVFVRFGGPVSINCSTSTTDFFGMGWESAYGGTALTDLSPVIWTVEEVKDWAIDAKCLIISESHQCTKMPHITLYSEYKCIQSDKVSYWQKLYVTFIVLACYVEMKGADTCLSMLIYVLSIQIILVQSGLQF